MGLHVLSMPFSSLGTKEVQVVACPNLLSYRGFAVFLRQCLWLRWHPRARLSYSPTSPFSYPLCFPHIFVLRLIFHRHLLFFLHGFSSPLSARATCMWKEYFGYQKHRLCFVRGVFFTPLLKQQPEICMVWCGEIVIADLGAVSQNDALKRRATWKQSGGSKLGLLHVPDLHNAEQSCKRQDSSRKFRVGGRLWCLSSKFVMPWEVLSRLRIKTTATSPSQNCCQDSSLAQATLHTS